jgi:hypothetical protein
MTSPGAKKTSGIQVPRPPRSWVLSFTDDRSPATWIPSFTGSCRVQAQARMREPSRVIVASAPVIQQHPGRG